MTDIHKPAMISTRSFGRSQQIKTNMTSRLQQSQNSSSFERLNETVYFVRAGPAVMHMSDRAAIVLFLLVDH